MLIKPQSSSIEHDRCCTDIPTDTKDWYSLNEFIFVFITNYFLFFCHHKQLLATTFFHLFRDCSWLPRDWNEKRVQQCTTENKYWPIIRQNNTLSSPICTIVCYKLLYHNKRGVEMQNYTFSVVYKCVRRGNKFPCFNKNPQFNWTEQRNGSSVHVLSRR